MPNYTELVLARVLVDIEAYQKQVQLSDSDNALLNQLENRIRAFEHIQRGWLRSSGILADYWKSKELEKEGVQLTEEEKKRFQTITQEDLINEAIKSMRDGAGFAATFTKELLKDIEDGHWFS